MSGQEANDHSSRMDLPASFGRAEVSTDAIKSQRFAKSRRIEAEDEDGSSAQRRIASTADDEVDEDDDGEDDETGVADILAHDLPVSHEAVLQDHAKTVSALSIDPAGARVVTGGYDYECKLWDFAGMDTSFKPFRTFEPVENYQVHDVQFNLQGDSILVAAGNWQPKLFSRDGAETYTYAKGDMYLRDMKNTAGHIAELTTCQWHPKDPETFLTASNDSSIRLWDVNKRDKSKSVIVVKSKDRGTRTKITAATFSLDGRNVAGAGMDGALHIWSTASNFARPNASVEGAHEKQHATSGLVYSLDTHSLVSRSTDGTVKLWDVRKFKKPVAVRDNLPSLNDESNVIYSPDGNFILTGTAGAKAAIVPGRAEAPADASREKGKIVVLKRETLEIARELTVSEGSVVRVAWHPRINQIFATTSLGAVHVLYSPDYSQKGATLVLAREPRRLQTEDVLMRTDGNIHHGAILTPNALPMYRDETDAMGRSTKRKRDKDRKDPVKSRMPLPPIKGPGKGGRVGASATQHVVKDLVRDTTRDEDPREALLRFAEQTKGDESMWTAAWKKTQPKTIYSNVTEEEQDQIEDEQRQQHRGQQK